jgi:hypothetical protein
VDGTQTRKSRKLLEPYREQIQELIERGFQPSQILKKLQNMFPGVNIKRTTLNDYCIKLRTEIFDYSQYPAESAPALSEGSALAPFVNAISQMLDENKPMTAILATIKADGYSGSYASLRQYCQKVKPVTYIKKKAVRKVKRRTLVTAVWSNKSDLTEGDMDYICDNYPVFNEIKGIIFEFRKAYSSKDIDAVTSWCEKYSHCRFPAICSFINGINADADAFYNSMKFTYSNGLLEGCVNKLKAVKRSMYGRASYSLLRAKLLLANGA